MRLNRALQIRPMKTTSKNVPAKLTPVLSGPQAGPEVCGYLINSGWIRLIFSHHEEHEDHKGKTHELTFILSCPSCPPWLWLPHLSFLFNHILFLLTSFSGSDLLNASRKM
jgi:hypothetical protein